MADKTVNVNIKYNVDTSQVARAEAASAAAQKATDELRKTVENYGKAAAQANKVTQDSLKKTSADVATLTKDFGGLYTSVKAIFTAGLAKEFIDLTLNMAKLSGQVEGVTLAFNRISNATLLLDQLRKATHGTVTDLNLMQKALTAQNFRIPLEKLGTLLEFAAVKAQQTGQEVNHLVDYIVSGIGYRSIKRLDDLGFTANRVREALGGVSLQAASMGQVMDAVTKLMQEDLEKTGGFAETSATKVGILERKWHDLRVAISETLTSPGLLSFYEGVLDNLKIGVDYLSGGVVKVKEGIQKANAVTEVQSFKEMYLTKEILKDKQKTFDIIQQEANSRQQQIGRNNDEIKEIEERINGFKKDEGEYLGIQRAVSEGLLDQLSYYRSKNIMLKESIRILNEYNKSLDKVTEKEGLDGEERPLVTDPVSFGIKGRKKTFVEKSLEQELVNVTEQIQKAADKLFVLIPVRPAPPTYQDSEWQKAWEENREAIVDSALANTNNLIQSELQAEADAYSVRIEMARNFYDEQQILAGDNKRAKDQLRLQEERELQTLERRKADREKKAAQAGILVNTALAIIKIFAGEGTYVDKLIRAGIMAGEGATQYAIASRARYYAKGEINIKGPGSETSDSIPAMLSKGESIMTAKQTREAFGILTDIRAGKLNDRVLKQLVTNGGSQMVMDDSRIVDAIKSQPKPPDLIRSGRQIYEVYTDQQNNKRFIRSKSI